MLSLGDALRNLDLDPATIIVMRHRPTEQALRDAHARIDASQASVEASAAAVRSTQSALDAVKKACPDDVDALDAAFTQLLDALDGIVETTQTTAVGPPA